MKLHASHVRHAIDPTLEAAGPGMGYGLMKTVDGAILHTTLASNTVDASDAVKIHTDHVVTSLNNVIVRSRLALAEAQAINDATIASEAAPHAVKMAEVTQASLDGIDVFVVIAAYITCRFTTMTNLIFTFPKNHKRSWKI